MMPRKNVLFGKVLVMMTSLTVCGASKLPPPPFAVIGSTGAGVGPSHSPMDTAAAAADDRSDDPFLAFLKLNGVELSTEAAPRLEADTEVGESGDRIKRTGSVLGPLLGSKIPYLSKGSHHVHFHNYHSPNKKCDKWSLWDFKKAILNKLLEAAKAIGGGVLALKGKLLTLKGHLTEINGRKLAEKGVDLTEFGKSVIAKVLGHGTTAHSAPSAPSGPAEAHAALSIPPSGGGYGHHSLPPPPPPVHPPQPHGGYGVPTGHGGGHGHPSGPGFDAAASLLDEFNTYGFDRNSEHRRGTIHAGLLVLQPLKRQTNSYLSQRSTGAGVAPSGPDMVPSASENSEERVQEPLRLSFSHTPLVLSPEIMESLTMEVGVPVESGNANVRGQPQESVASPSENTEHWVAPPNLEPLHTQAVFPNRLLSASLSGQSASSAVQSPEGAMANVIAKLHGQSSHFAGAASKRR